MAVKIVDAVFASAVAVAVAVVQEAAVADTAPAEQVAAAVVGDMDLAEEAADAIEVGFAVHMVSEVADNSLPPAAADHTN